MATGLKNFFFHIIFNHFFFFNFSLNNFGQLGVGVIGKLDEWTEVMKSDDIMIMSRSGWHNMIYKKNGDLYVFGRLIK